MKTLVLAALYTALALGANAVRAADTAALADLRSGDMKKLVFAEAPAPAALDTAFVTAEGAEVRLSDYAGKHVLLNFWATWCAPCRKEMPMLAALQDEFGGDTFEVVTVATGRNSPAGIDRFFAEIGVSNLPRHRDPQQALARQMAVLGLPITVLLDPEGNEIARLRGDADWASDSARAIIAAMIGAPEG
jgi:thiol-disulfide isomerase/thioredoxin